MATDPKLPPMLIPALRAVMGDRVYFITTLRLKDVAQRISFAREVHPSEALNDLIQRRLSDKRAEEIGDYLMREEQRFFNALVVGVYAGDPTWQDFGSITPEQPSDELLVPAHASETFGFLRLAGGEDLFALDGQHRLAGIKRAVARTSELNDDRVAVIFIAHHAGEDGLRRTRRLFTVLNKTARPVLKGDIIALDEDDLMAICTRRLVNNCTYFKSGQVAMRLMNSLPPSDRSSWTTITMLYDLLTTLFSEACPALQGARRTPLARLKNRRASDAEIDKHFTFATNYFKLLGEHFPPVGDVFFTDDHAKAVAVHRNANGGHVLFRPLGQNLFTQIAARLCKSDSIGDSIAKLGLLPTNLAEPPYANVIWNPTKGTMINSGPAASLCRDLLLHMLGGKPQRASELLHRYADFIGEPRDRVELPQTLL